MRQILFIFTIFFCGLILYPDSVSNKIIKSKDNQKASSIKIKNTEYVYSIDEKETEYAKKLYSELLKINLPLYKLNTLPVYIINLKNKNLKNKPLFVLSEQELPDNKFKIFIIKKNIETFFIDKILPILKNRINYKLKLDNTELSKLFYLKFLLSRLAHFTGPSIVQNSDKEFVCIDKTLTNNLPIIENIRSEISTILVLDSLIKKEIISEKQLNKIIYQQIAYLIYLSENGSHDKKRYSNKIVDFFKQKGCIISNILSKKIVVDLKEYKKIAKKLFQKMTKFELKSDSEKNIGAIAKFLADSEKNKLIEKKIEVIKPNGNEEWILGTKKKITWKTKGLTNNIKITIWKKDKFIDIIVRNISPSLEKYVWKVGKCKKKEIKNGKGYIIKIREQGGKAFKTQDESDNPFTIVKKNKRKKND